MILFVHRNCVKRVPLDVIHLASMVIVWDSKYFTIFKNRWGPRTDPQWPISIEELPFHIFQYGEYFSFEESQSIIEAIMLIAWYVSTDELDQLS